MTSESRRQLARQVKEFRSYLRRRYRNDAEFRRALLTQIRLAVRMQARSDHGATKHDGGEEEWMSRRPDIVQGAAS